jgi:catechol 2,3-dioxygenase-like lactoylglutathione lyase family enzyme
MHLRTLHIGVQDLERSVAFYQDGLGLPVEADPGGSAAIVVLSCGARILLDQALGERLQVGPHYQGNAPHVHIHLEVGDMDAILDRLAAHDHPIGRSEEDYPGMRIIVTADPDGHNLQLFESAEP